MCGATSGGRRREPPPETTGPRTFSYGPKGVQKTTVDIPKESKASPDYKPPGTPKRKKTDTASLNIPSRFEE